MSAPNDYPGNELSYRFPWLIGHAVLKIQQRLAQSGLACADIKGGAVLRTAHGAPQADIAGVFGRHTMGAVRRYQSQKGLREDGVVGPHTWSAIFGTPAPARNFAAAPGPAQPRPPLGIDVEARSKDMGLLHPLVRDQVNALLHDLDANSIPMGVFEAFRSPERQAHLYAQGRNAAGRTVGAVVTNARPFESYHQYGLAVDIVINRPGMNPWTTGTAESDGWWKRFHQLADQHGLEPLSWEMPHVQLKGTSAARLLRGEYPAGGDDAWASNLAQAIERWQGANKPPPPQSFTRPPLAAQTLSAPTLSAPTFSAAARLAAPAVASAALSAGLAWHALPRVPDQDWTSRFGGQRWRVDQRGIYLDDSEERPIRSRNEPATCRAIVQRLGPIIVKNSAKHHVPPELILMTIATEAGSYGQWGFTGPRTFRWEPKITDYSAGPMQILSATARGVNKQAKLGYDDDQFPPLAAKPEPPPAELGLYDPEIAIDVGTALIAHNIKLNGPDPILTAAAYNAGSLKPSDNAPWRILTYGDHLRRSSEFYGDACAVLGSLRVDT